METIRAWTRQHEGVLRALEEEGLYRVKEAHIRGKNGDISEYYLELYAWYAREAAKRIPCPEGASYPIWLFLDEAEKLPPLAGSVLLELELPRSLVLITDVDRWGYRVNYMYVPEDAADARRHDEELRRFGIENETALIQTDKGNFYPLLKRKIIASWQRVFAMPPQGFGVRQGTVWELRREWLRGVQRAL